MANVDNLTVKLHVDVKTLRDEFAMAALSLATDGIWDVTKFSAVAERAYQIADAMIEARKS